jgi:hypothetical protein
MVKISVGWGGQFQGSEADIVQGFVINTHAFIGVFDQLMDGKGGVVWFDDGIRYFWGWDDGEGFHNSVWVFFSNFGDKESSHSGSSSSSEGVGNLESLETVASLGFLSNDIED